MGTADALRALTDVELADLLSRRPELADPPAANFHDLASRASAPYSLQACLAHLRAPVRDVLDGLAYLGEPSTVRDLADLAGTPTDLARLAEAADDARRLGLVVAQRIHDDAPVSFNLIPALRRLIPSPFSLRQPLLVLLERYAVNDLRAIVHNLGLGDHHEPKPKSLARIVDHLTVASNVQALLERAPHDAERFLLGVHELGGVAGVDTRPYGRETLPDGLLWLFGHALLVPLDWETSVVPREIALALRGGTPLRAYQLQPPVPVAEPAGGRTGRLPSMIELPPPGVVDAIAAIGLGLAREPITPLRSGGVAVRDVRAIGKQLGIDDRSVARLLDLAGHAKLIVVDFLRSRVVSTPPFEEWLAQPPLERWLGLVRAWATLGESLTRPTGSSGARSAPLTGMHYADDNHIWRRGFVLQSLAREDRFDLPTLVATARWHGPGRWADVGNLEDAVLELLEEASLLGLLRDGTLSQLGRAALFGSDAEIHAAAASVFAPATSTFTVQADLTALAPQELDAVVASTLARCAHVESRGAATLYRFSEASLRRAFDLGETAASVHAFLEEHARPAVPQPLRYLVDDVARRYGVLRTGDAVAYLRCEDPMLLAEVLRSKKLAKLKLRALAPTVAVSSVPVAKLLAALRDNGFLPVAEDADGAAIVAPQAPEASAYLTSTWLTRSRPQADAIWQRIVAGVAASSNGGTDPAAGSAVGSASGEASLESFSPKVLAAVQRLRSAG